MENQEIDEYDNFSPIPIRRFFAKTLDNIIWMSFFGRIFIFVFVLLPIDYNEFNFYVLSIIFVMICFYFSMMIDAWWISKYKTTIGKRMFKIWLTDYTADNLSFTSAWNRNKSIMKDGLGYLIPIYSFFKLYNFYDMQIKKTYKKGQAYWDKTTDSIIYHQKTVIIPYVVVLYLIYKNIAGLSQIPDLMNLLGY